MSFIGDISCKVVNKSRPRRFDIDRYIDLCKLMKEIFFISLIVSIFKKNLANVQGRMK